MPTRPTHLPMPTLKAAIRSLAKLVADLRQHEEVFKKLTPKGSGPHGMFPNPSQTHILVRGNYLSPGDPVEPGIPEVLDNPRHPYRFPGPAPTGITPAEDLRSRYG
jgi:hypothetical protein